jgi:cytidylate kinase
MTQLKPIIAIDGPAGSGKSTIAKRIAKKCDLFYIDTGAMYRALALKAKHLGIDPENNVAIVKISKNINIELKYEAASSKLTVFLDGKDVSEEIRKPSITEHVSTIAKIKEVREQMVLLQRKMAEGKNAILEGRDITTVVFPDAYKKFYLDADPEERIKRRFLELKDKKIAVDEAIVQKDITFRDKTDSTREHAPLKRAQDAIYIDTTHLSIDEVVCRVLKEIQKKP